MKRIAISLALALGALSAIAAVPQLINFQGKNGVRLELSSELQCPSITADDPPVRSVAHDGYVLADRGERVGRAAVNELSPKGYDVGLSTDGLFDGVLSTRYANRRRQVHIAADL
jgi:hypothetical protein